MASWVLIVGVFALGVVLFVGSFLAGNSDVEALEEKIGEDIDSAIDLLKSTTDALRKTIHPVSSGPDSDFDRALKEAAKENDR